MGPCHRTHSVVEPKSSKVYPLSPVEQKELDSFLEENLCTGRIRPSKSPMAALVFFIKKKDGSLWLVQDYQALNSMTVKNKYPLPLISSDFTIGAVLSQQSMTDRKWHPVAFYSKSLFSMERNYKIHDKEMLAIIRVLEE